MGGHLSGSEAARATSAGESPTEADDVGGAVTGERWRLPPAEPRAERLWRDPAPRLHTPPAPAAPRSQPDLRLILGIVAALLFAYAGYQMTNLRSVGANTVAGSFDQALGWFAFGMAALSLALAVRR